MVLRGAHSFPGRVDCDHGKPHNEWCPVSLHYDNRARCRSVTCVTPYWQRWLCGRWNAVDLFAPILACLNVHRGHCEGRHNAPGVVFFAIFEFY